MALRLLAPLSRTSQPTPLRFLATSFALPISITVPPLLADLWESVLRAVPKKKTSHMKKRHRQMAGKALKDVQSLNKCPGCGQVKRAHLLCPHCVKEIKESWKTVQTA
ncbi:54S ribosomal protein L32 [Penicillium hispanicum]|uniref:54S ribosomal protein L32 n=1 Tax=Penicillium hispanicum TaxID=1080232 RepID=UPI00253FBA1F|nr:54S ribosomal protein L32 [Penicillium hispanicum]KAJ5587932.1 54S ribosomal protein L32 [Penicillium hispanicum]